MNNEYIEALKIRRKELQEEIQVLDSILSRYLSPGSPYVPESGEEQPDMFTPILSDEKSKSMASTVKNAIRKLVEHPYSLQIDDISKSLDRYNIDVNKSNIHNALRSLRENGEVMAYKINNSNQYVFYISPEGVDQSFDLFKIKPDYRPNHIRESDIETFEFLD